MSETHFRSYFWPFQIDTQLYFVLKMLTKWLPIGHFGCPRLTFDHISGHFKSARIFFLQNGCRRPFWMSENHFRSHFWPFQINTNFFFKFLQNGRRNSLSIAFLAISDRYAIYFFEFFDKMAAGGHFGCPKFTFDCICDHFRSIGHFGYLKFTFDSNSGHFRSIQNFFLKFWTKWPPAAILDVRK